MGAILFPGGTCMVNRYSRFVTGLILMSALPLVAGNFTEKELALFRATVQGNIEGVKAAGAKE
jgi:hypothetical protein